MSNWIEEYKRYPHIKDYHLRQLAQIEVGSGDCFIMQSRRLTSIWVNIAILNDKLKAADILLDRLNVPTDLNLKEKLAYISLT